MFTIIWEGFPKCLIEAAAYGLPAYNASDVPGCRDAIINNKTGILVKAKNSTSLINGLEKLIKIQRKENYLVVGDIILQKKIRY